LALGGPELAFALAAIAAALAVPCLLRLTPDERPVYIGRPKLRQAIDQTSEGARALLAHPGLRLLGATLTVLLFFEGMADVLAVVVVLDLLGLGEGAVGYMNASWGIGALLAGGALAVMIHRSQLSLAIGGGSALAGAGAALVAGWPVAAAAFIAWFAFGAGYTFVEVAAKTFSQRLGTDEQLARVFGFLETARLTAMALGSIVAPLLVALVGVRGAVLAAVRCSPHSPSRAGWRTSHSRLARPSIPTASRFCARTRSSARSRWTRSSASATTWNRFSSRRRRCRHPRRSRRALLSDRLG
jgi:hypothetical protein